MDQTTNPMPESSTPELPKDIWENKIPYQPPKESKPVWRWLWISLVILFIVAGLGYAGVRYWSTISQWFSREAITNNTTDNTISTDTQVAWQKRELINNLNLMLDVQGGDPSYTPSETPNTLARYYKMGTFISGIYKDNNLIIASLQPQNTMGGGTYLYYFVQKVDGQLIMLTNHSQELYTDDGINRNNFTTDNTCRISSLFFPQTLKNLLVDSTAGNGSQPLEATDTARITSATGKNWFDEATVAEHWRKVFTDPAWGDVYTDPMPTTLTTPATAASGPTPRYGFYLQAPDGTIRTYKLIPDAVLSSYANSTDQPNFLWKDGTRSQDEYLMTEIGGCGVTNLAAVMPDSLMNDLVVATKSENSTVIYELKDNNHSLLKQLYESAKSNPDNNGLTYTKFIKAHPLFFWKDSFGRLIKFQDKKFMPQAECGKPVIYLYPEKTTKVSVKVAPQGGLSYSEPDYGQGWTVWADPAGKLTDIVSGKTYPYLFWEGKGGLYQSPDKGWVVAKSEVNSFLDQKLSQLGLIDQEINDFKEFWLPRMQSAPYYQIGFWGNQEMNRLAPLTISPKPDTIIRVLMDFTPLAKPIKIESYSMGTPKRTGFTVVEWGGVIK